MIHAFPSQRRAERGSVLVVCMVLAALGTLGVAAWISLLDARGHQVEANVAALERRAAYQSSKALAYEAIFANHLHTNSGLATDTTYTLPDGLGEAVVKAYGAVPLNNATSLRSTKNGATPIESWSTDVEVTTTDGIGTYDWNFELRNYNPILGGELLAMHSPVNFDTSDSLITGNLVVRGRASLWDVADKDFGAGFRADEFLLPNSIVGTTSLTDSTGSAVLPLNYPFPKQTTGLFGATPAYASELDITQSTTNAHNAYANRLVATGISDTMNGFVGKVIGPGPDTIADGSNDATLETQIASGDPAFLMTALPPNYPLSSRVLRAVADKNNPPFSADQLYDIFSAQIPAPNDALAYLTATHSAKIGSRSEDLHAANQSAAWNSGDGRLHIVLERTTLPHLVVERATELVVHGQEDAAAASAASLLDPRGIVIANTGSDSIDFIEFREQNLRRIVLAVSTELGATPPLNGYDANMNFVGSLPFPTWNMILELQNTGALVSTAAIANAIVVGGIRTNRRINVVDGTLTLRQEFNEDGFETLLSRNAWIEAYRK